MKLPSRYVTWDKITMTLEQQDKIYGWWKEQTIDTLDNCPFERGVIICKDAVQTPNGLYDGCLAFELLPEHIRLEEMYSFDSRVVRRWELLYEGTVINGEPNFQITHERFDLTHRQRMLSLTTIFLSIVNFIAHY